MAPNGIRLSDTLIRGLVAAAAIVVVVAGLRAAAALLVPLVVAMFVAMLCHPFVEWLRDRRVPRPVAVGLTLFVLVILLLGPGLVVHGAGAQFATAAPRYGARVEEMTTASFQWLEVRGVDTERLTAIVNSAAVLDLAGAVFSGVAVLLSNAFIVLFVVAFLLLDGGALAARVGRTLGLGPDASERFSRANREVQHYLWIKTLVSLATGLLVGVWTAVLDVDFAILWGLLAFLLNYIPNFGSILASVPPMLLALIQFGPGRALAVVAGYLVVNTVLGNLVEPYLMGRRLRISPLIVLLVLVFWGWVWGTMGLLLAVPLTMVVKILLENSAELRWLAELLGGASPAPAPADARHHDQG